MAAHPYVFREFPKHVIVNGRTFTCNNEDEEIQAMAEGKRVTGDDERKRLMEIVKIKNVPGVDGRWGLEKIEAAIRNAGHDPAFDPSK